MQPYQPAAPAVAALLATVATRCPPVQPLAVDAAAILAAGNVHNHTRLTRRGPLFPGDWCVRTAADGEWRRVSRTPALFCTCRQPAISVAEGNCCRHLLAFLCYWRLVEDELNRRVAAGALPLINLHANRPELTPTYVPAVHPIGYVFIAHDGRRYILPTADDLDRVAYALPALPPG